MKAIDPGHLYALDTYDGDDLTQTLRFMKREGHRYPGNAGAHPGTNSQEVIRVLIDRIQYLQQQWPCIENLVIMSALRTALCQFELRAARLHNALDQRTERVLTALMTVEAVEGIPTCPECGHICCKRHTALVPNA